MSARKILGRNKDILKKNKLLRQINEATIRTFLDPDSLQLISQPSNFYLLVSSENTKDELNKLRMMAAHRKIVYLTDIQFLWTHSYFTMHQNPTEGKWFGDQYSNIKDYNIYINPQITEFKGQKQQVKQNCHSFPFLTAVMERYPSITLKYTKVMNLDQKSTKIISEEVQEKLEGFQSIVAQHCVDHLKGRHFFNQELSKGRLQLFDIGTNFQNTKFLLKQYNVLVKKTLQADKNKTEQFQKLKNEYQQKIRKSLKQEMNDASKNMNKFKSQL